ncbi:MAG TPA: hypothetical protein PLE74_13265 [Candidatus Cloacimonadota bacterium]|nr:hypothetical protein [Candidatus Cloacimonadota bacterium]HPT73239.1 hypothetical protein [Candidatus Cloacimonadota bacterium]
MLKFYFSLQARRIHRSIVNLGVHPVLSYLFIIVAFYSVSYIFSFKQVYYPYSYILIALFAVSRSSAPEHNDFLKLTYPKKTYSLIRMIENIVVAIPFMVYLCYMGNYNAARALCILALIPAFMYFKFQWRLVIPTPFGRNPFEFIVGFRITFPLFLFAYFLTYISLHVHNFYIGIFAMCAVSILCTMFHMKVEDHFYVWIYSMNARQFLFRKLRTAVFYTLLSCSPVLIALSIGNPGRIPEILAFQTAGIILVCAGAVAKYTSFPDDIALREGMLVMFSVMCPVLLLFAIPFMYLHAKRNLEGILE